MSWEISVVDRRPIAYEPKVETWDIKKIRQVFSDSGNLTRQLAERLELSEALALDAIALVPHEEDCDGQTGERCDCGRGDLRCRAKDLRMGRM